MSKRRKRKVDVVVGDGGRVRFTVKLDPAEVVAVKQEALAKDVTPSELLARIVRDALRMDP